MALIPLNVHAIWRPWQQAGLPHLLLEEDEACAIQTSLAERRQPDMARRHGVMVSPSGQTPVLSAQPSPSPAPAVVKQAESTAVETPSAVLPSSLPPSLHPDQWPSAWIFRLQKTPPKPRLVWTYGLLAQDFAGEANGKLRGDFFRTLFAELGMPQGSHALWPLNAEAVVEADALFFGSGIQVLNPETLVFMGDDDDPAFETLAFPRIHPLSSAIWRGRRFVRLHGVDCLREDSASRRHSILSLLKTFHRPRG